MFKKNVEVTFIISIKEEDSIELQTLLRKMRGISKCLKVSRLDIEGCDVITFNRTINEGKFSDILADNRYFIYPINGSTNIYYVMKIIKVEK